MWVVMVMDDAITLIKETVTGHDTDGNEVRERSERELLCQVFGVTRNEFYSASTAGLHPDIVVRLADHDDYEGEGLAEYDGELYSIIRTYRDRGSMQQGRISRWSGMDPNAIELTLQRRVGNG